MIKNESKTTLRCPVCKEVIVIDVDKLTAKLEICHKCGVKMDRIKRGVITKNA